ncbi:MAG: hypothetical protein DCC43_12965 [Candidatus Brocadia sp.]|jgi:Xaa-Pro aminopeptidase|nr:Aminopeptidase YpdF [Candidatus Brocadia fulgida]MCC6326396.1 aminopeptidase P family protein [Candidatus Brocadia sp.]MCE7912756.1 aminopeptidase P family protein [Candidatus Brocadia sp. AMX3]OQY97539.1 MAG: hypothetical protein B6D35_14835 [Candidatus Brocadia sp. UTAMX2]MDG5997372.1 aminopeptidase P family protein [Candidatus Brocadia sp.]
MNCLKKIKQTLTEEHVDGFLVTNAVNIHYITKFTGSESILLITRERDYLFTDFRYVEQAQKDIPWITVVEKKVSLERTISAKLKRLKIKKLSIEALFLTVHQYHEILGSYGGIHLIPTKGIVEEYRKRKTDQELEKIRTAISIAEKAYNRVEKKIGVGLSEKKIADILELEIRNHGGERSAFEIICATGQRASLPHAHPTERIIGEKEAILIDWGACFQFYNSDLTRVRFIDKISPDYKKIYQIVLDAQGFAIDSIKPGRKAKEIDSAARSYIEKKGFAKCFGHGLGHGIGLEVHEGPVINSRSKEVLEENMVFTVEPGIYIPGWGGIRIEDMVLVTPSGCEVLSRIPKRLEEIAG